VVFRMLLRVLLSTHQKDDRCSQGKKFSGERRRRGAKTEIVLTHPRQPLLRFKGKDSGGY